MESPYDAPGWYESNLPSKERKRRGHFSTPSPLVEQILDACGYTPEADLAQIRVLDPACGGGNFLAAAARRLVAFSICNNSPQAAHARLVQRNLWGFDPDPISCFLTEVQLQAASATSESRSRRIHRRLHIHQADALALPWEPCIDLFLANPPYLAAKNTDLSGYQSAHQRGQTDSYLLFLHLALQTVRPSGWIGLVLPDPLLARANATEERKHLLAETTIHHLWHFSGVFAAEVGAVVIIAQKCPPPRVHQVSWVRGQWENVRARRGDGATQVGHPTPGSRKGPSTPPPNPLPLHVTELHSLDGRLVGPLRVPSQQIPQSLFLRQPGAELRYFLNSEHGAIIERLRAHLDEATGSSCRLAPLSQFLSLSRGEELGKGNPHITPLPTKTYTNPPTPGHPQGAAPTIHDAPNSPGSLAPLPYYPVLLGGVNIRPYRVPIATQRIACEAIVKPLERYLSPKLLVVKSTDRLQAALDMQSHVVLQTLYLLHLRTKEMNQDELYFFLALLNSRLLREYVSLLHTSYKWVQPQIELSVLAHLPIPLTTSPLERQEIITRAKLLVQACSQGDPVVEWDERIRNIYEEQERAICALYDAALHNRPVEAVSHFPSG